MTQNPLPPTALVTGAAQRLGREIALHLARHGWAVGVHYKNSRSAADDLVGEIERLGGQAVALQADLAQMKDVGRLVPECVSRLGPPTCLVNNASIYEWDSLATLASDAWDAHLNLNLKAPIFLAQAFAEALPAEAFGNVINIIDQKVLRPDPDYFSYTASKSALWNATQTMAQALAPRIRVNAVGPGPVFRSARQDETEFEHEWRSTPLRQRVSPEEICAAIQLILASPAMTGQMIALDSGQHLAWSGGKPD
jgi:NAD(P)-dependent dehydrogenase (short-subunit alcohol dehydrogenase family)